MHNAHRYNFSRFLEIAFFQSYAYQVYALKASDTSTEVNCHHNQSDAALQPAQTRQSLTTCSRSYNEEINTTTLHTSSLNAMQSSLSLQLRLSQRKKPHNNCPSNRRRQDFKFVVWGSVGESQGHSKTGKTGHVLRASSSAIIHEDICCLLYTSPSPRDQA